MIFRSRNKKLDVSDEIFISGCNTKQVQTTKFLGAIIDCNLTWKYHVNYVCSKISKNIGILIKSRKIFILFWHYIIHLYTHTWITVSTYGVQLMLYTLTKCFFCRKKAVRIIQGVNRRAHSEPLFSSLCVLSVSKVYVYNIGLVMYKYHHGLLPHLSHMFEKKLQYSSVQYTAIKSFACSLLSYRIGKKFKAVTIWNVIFENISVDIEIGTFKRHLKSYILSNSIETIQ